MYDKPMFLVATTPDPVSVALTTGHAIAIDSNGRMVPPHFIAAAFQTGRVAPGIAPTEVPAQDGFETPIPHGKTDTTGPAEHEAQQAKIQQIKEAIKRALESGDESFLTAAGIPDSRKLDALVGVRVSAQERDQAWAELQVEAQNG